MQTQSPKLTAPIRASHDKRAARRIQKIGCVLLYRKIPILNPAVEKRKWRRSPRCEGRQAGILEFGLDKFLKNPQQDEFPALWVGQLLRSSDQAL